MIPSQRPLRIVITGSECTGKTTLAHSLANLLGAPVSKEAARDFVDELQRAIEFSDVETIAHRQIAIEDTLITAQAPIVIFDTDLFSTLIYSNLYFGQCPNWIEPLCHQRRADLYLLCKPDLPWVNERFQRSQSTKTQQRHAHELFTQKMKQGKCLVTAIDGLNGTRLRNAVKAMTEALDLPKTAVDQLLKSI